MSDLRWPSVPPAHGRVVLRGFEERDVAVVRDLATDPYVPQTGSLVADADHEAALAYLATQRGRHLEGVGFSFCVADADSDVALGQTGLWVRDLADGRATAGYAIAPSARGRGLAADALLALTGFAWMVPGLHRVTLYVDSWNVASATTAERAGYQRDGLLRSWIKIGGRRVAALV